MLRDTAMTLDPKIYRRAAERTVNGRHKRGCCDWINRVTKLAWSAEANTFVKFFEPDGLVLRMYWMGDLTDEHRLDRSLALLFMEQIAMDLMKEKKV